MRKSLTVDGAYLDQLLKNIEEFLDRRKQGKPISYDDANNLEYQIQNFRMDTWGSYTGRHPADDSN